MAKDLLINGTTYTGVEKISIPTADGGEAVFAESAAGIAKLITNDSSIIPTGSYHNSSFGAKIGYCSNGDIIVAMKGGTSSNYENIVFNLGTVPTGVSITTTSSTVYSTDNATGGLYCCIIHGLKVPATMSIAYKGVNSSYDYALYTITITAVT